MTRTGWWRLGLMLFLLAAVVTLVARFGPPDWLLSGEHPVRNVLEGLSWPAGVLALVWVAAPSAWRWMRPPPAPEVSADEHAGSGRPSVSDSTIWGPNLQAGGNITDIRLGDAALPTPPRPEPESELR